MSVNSWTRTELLVAFNLYCRTAFGRLHKANPDIIFLSQKIGRTPSSVAMKLVNFASLDPVQQARRIRGLSNASQADRAIWEEFNADPEKFAYESQRAVQEVIREVNDSPEKDFSLPSGLTETVRTVRARLVQGFFRDAVLSGYDFKCAMCGYDLPELLNASHIIPWRNNVTLRADPRNGLSLCAMHDRAFDRGLLTLGDAFDILLAERLRMSPMQNELHTVAFLAIEGNVISLPKRFAPDQSALAYHREHIFKG